MNVTKLQMLTGAAVLAAGISIAASFSPVSDKLFEISRNIEIFANVYRELNMNYVDDIDPGKLMRTGIDAMVASLDPFTNYISEADIESYRLTTEGRYNGIGASSEKIGDYVTLTELYEGFAADKAGLKVGDQILAIDGKDAKRKDPESLNEILRGFPGTSVQLKIRRPGRNDEFSVSLVRAEVDIPNVPYSGLVGDHIGYVNLSTFTQDAGRNVQEAVRKLKTEDPELKGIILDLRGNGGGLLHEAVNVCNTFIGKDLLVATNRGKIKEQERGFSTFMPPVDENIPLAVLIDKKSASASEIVSGVMQDYDRGVLLGQRSYGKGLVQNIMEVGYNARVKVTTAKYYIPSGRCIQSVEYLNGEPVDIPDSRRTKFTTRNGRTVLDGGGVTPDLLLKQPADDPIVKALINEHLIFDFVTEFCLNHPEIPAVNDFKFSDFDAFLKFVESRNFSYETESEKVLRDFVNKAGADGFSVDKEVSELEKSIRAAKKSALANYRTTILDLIERDIAGRYFYKTGKIKMTLRNDAEVSEAKAVLLNPQQYKDILKMQ
jgi:carboxyl-terminal processing protease